MLGMNYKLAQLEKEGKPIFTGIIAETVSIAKRDLKAGEMLDGIGGYTIRGDFIRYDHVQLDETSLIVELRRTQDALFKKV